jgi:large subunit ribosomal protein L32
LAIAIPVALQSIPGLLGDIWEGILRAVPKKKTSHMKKRHRLLAGKALKDVTSLNKCPACGSTKKMHTLCPQCMGSVYPRDEPLVRNTYADKFTEIQGMFPNTSKPDDVVGAAA